MENLIAKKNDQLRARLPSPPRPHQMVMTEGVRALSAEDKWLVIKAIKEFGDFNTDNDPYGEHDCIFVDVEGKKYICKIDYYDDSFEGFEENGNRVFTIMGASEY